MKTDVSYDETWSVRITREEGDEGWPEKVPVSGTRTRFLRPDKITFKIWRGFEEPSAITVLGDRIGEPSKRAISHWRPDAAPEWLLEIVGQVRQASDIGRSQTGSPP